MFSFLSTKKNDIPTVGGGWGVPKNTVGGRISRLVSSVESFGGNPITGGRSDKQARQQRQPLRDFSVARCHPDPLLKPQLLFCFGNSLLIAEDCHGKGIPIAIGWEFSSHGNQRRGSG